MDRSSVRTFVTFLGHAFLNSRRSSRPNRRQKLQGTSAQRRLTGFVLLAFGLTQIVYPMNLLAAGRTLPGSPPPDSFIQHQVNSVPALVSEIEHDVKVRKNYARHFGMPANQIAGYLNKNLSIQTLRRPYRHIVYCVRPDGVFFYVHQTMPAGTKVFALKSSGRPVLKWACGNPFTASLPQPDSVVTFLRRSKPPVSKPKAVTASNVEVITPNEAPAVIAPTEAVLPSTEVVGALPLTPAAFVVPAGIVGAGGASLLPFLPLIPVLFAFGGGGGGSNGNTTGGGTTSTATTGTSTATTGTSTATSTATTGTSTATTGTSTATTGTSTATTGTSTATTGTSTATTGTSTATTGTSTATTGTSTATTGTSTATSTATTGTSTATSTATTGTSTATTGTSTATTGTSTATTGTSTATTGTTGTIVPEPSGSSTMGYAFVALAFLAFASSMRRKRRSQD